jgi:hypothetical protein
MIARTILYILWYSWGALYFVMGIWAVLEKVGKSQKKQNPQDFFRPGVFVTIVAIVATIIDLYFIESLAAWVKIEPLLLRIALFPALLAVAAKITGPTKSISISANKKRPK